MSYLKKTFCRLGINPRAAGRGRGRGRRAADSEDEEELPNKVILHHSLYFPLSLIGFCKNNSHKKDYWSWYAVSI